MLKLMRKKVLAISHSNICVYLELCIILVDPRIMSFGSNGGALVNLYNVPICLLINVYLKMILIVRIAVT